MKPNSHKTPICSEPNWRGVPHSHCDGGDCTIVRIVNSQPRTRYTNRAYMPNADDVSSTGHSFPSSSSLWFD